MTSVESEGQDGEYGECERRREGHYKRHHGQPARGGRQAGSAWAHDAALAIPASASGERERYDGKQKSDRNRRNRLNEPHLAEQPRSGRCANEDRERQESRQEGPDCLGVLHDYCLT